MRLTDDLNDLRQRLEHLEAGPSVVGDWHRLEARTARMELSVHQELLSVQQDMIGFVRTEPPDPAWLVRRTAAQRLREILDELRLIKLCVQSRLFEIAVTAQDKACKEQMPG